MKITSLIFYLLVFFLSSQVGFHFWPKFAYINGVRVDYLSPTLYLIDILTVLFILFSVPRLLKNKINFAKNHFLKILFLLFILDLILNIFLSKSPGAHIFGLIKLGEFGVLGWLVAKTFTKRDIPLFVRTLSLSAIVSSVLAIWQFINQSSVGGLWYFLGERTFNSSTIGISTVNLDHQILRAYGAFPHPNVAAFFFLAATIFTVLRLPYEKSSRWKIFLIAAIVFSTLGLVVTFSRISIFLAVIFFLYYFLRQMAKHTRMLILGAISGILGGLGILAAGPEGLWPGGGFLSSTFLLRGIDFREELFAQSLKIFSENPYFGIGLNNFFVHQASLIKTISPIAFQPPHNIFVLALLSLGLFGWWIVPLVFYKGILRVVGKVRESKGEIREFYRSILFVLVSIIVVGIFDHFFLTVEQGQLMLALVLGLSFVRFKI